jgi:hypothetical protein
MLAQAVTLKVSLGRPSVLAIGCGRTASIALRIAAHSWILIDGAHRENIDLKRPGDAPLQASTKSAFFAPARQSSFD